MREAIETLVHGVVDRIYLWRDRRAQGESPVASGTAAQTKEPPAPIEWKKVGVTAGVRMWIDRRPFAVLVIALCVLGVCAVLYTGLTRPVGGDARVFFFDVGTGETFIADASTLPPISARSGATLPDGQPGGVRARMYACGGCADKSKLFVGYLERLAGRQRDAATSGTAPADVMVGFSDLQAFIHSGWLVASPASPLEWSPKDSPAGAKIMDAPFDRCEKEPKPEDRPAFECQPQ